MATPRRALDFATPVGGCLVCDRRESVLPLPDGVEICRSCAQRLGDLLARSTPRKVTAILALPAKVLDGWPTPDEAPDRSGDPPAGEADASGRKLWRASEDWEQQPKLDLCIAFYAIDRVLLAIYCAADVLRTDRHEDVHVIEALAIVFHSKHCRSETYDAVGAHLRAANRKPRE